MGLSCGMVGLPNVGKSTLFNALTRSRCAAENFPFCTIEPNRGQAVVQDPRFKELVRWAKPQKEVPETIELVDIAGLIRGAATGAGLGNQFLHHIREVDAILQVVRCFESEAVIHVEGKVDPLSDLEAVEMELMLADLEAIERWLPRLKSIKSLKEKERNGLEAYFQKVKAGLEAGIPARMTAIEAELRPWLKGYPLLSAKPMLCVANLSEIGPSEAGYQALAQACREKGYPIYALNVALESELAELSAEERVLFMEAYEMEEPGLEGLVREAFALLGLQTYFTVGEKEVRAWAIPKGFTAREAAGVIHTDFARGFIRAEVVAYEDFVRCGGEAGARAEGKWRLEGKEYLVQDGDIMHFRVNV